MSTAQIEHVAERLRRAGPSKLRIVIAHQPFGALELSDLSNLQHNADHALATWADAGLDLVMGGHIHLPYVLPLSRQYPSLPREVWIVQAGTALSSRVRGTSPNSFNRLLVGEGAEKTVDVERWDFQGDRFVVGERHALRWQAAQDALAKS